MAISRSLGQLTIDLVAKVGGWTSGLDKAERELKSRTSRMERNLKAFRTTLVSAFAAIGVGSLIRSIVTETAATERSLAQLDATLKATGDAAGYSREQLVRMADDLSNSSVFRSGDIIDAQSRLLTYTGIVGENLPRAMQAVIDYAAKFNVSLIQAAESVGKAVERPLKGMDSLGKQGFYLSEQQKKLARDLENAGRAGEAQAIVLDMLEESTKGAAEAARNTFGGALQAVSNNARELLTGKGGLTEATAELNKFADLLKDPATVEGANALTAAVIRLAGAAAAVATGAVRATQKIGELFAQAIHGPDFDTQVRRAKKGVEELQEVIARGERDLAGMDPGSRYARMLSRNIENRRAELVEAQKKLESMTFKPAQTSVDAGATSTVVADAARPATEEFLKLEASLKQQIALYGSVGEAAKIAYQIASGQLDELTDKEQQRILGLAREYDAIVESAKAVNERKQAQDQLARSFEQQVAGYERQIALTGEVTELERIRYEIANGGLKGLNDAQRERLELLAQEVDRIQEVAKAEADRKSLMAEGTALMESLRTPLEQYEASIERFNELRDQQAITEETYIRAVIKAQEDLRDATEKTNEYMLQAARNTQDILADTLFGAMEGKIDNIGKAFLKMINQMVAQALAADLATKLFGKDMKGGGWLDSLVSFGSGLLGRANGGPVSAGSMYRVNERGPELLSVGGSDYLMMGKQSGRVVPTEQIGGSRTIGVTNNYYGAPPDIRSQRQRDIETASRMRVAAARLG